MTTDKQEENIKNLQQIVKDSRHLVCICETGMVEENGYYNMESEDVACDMELKYGYSPEEVCSSSFFGTKKEKFFEFYRNEILAQEFEPNEAFRALAELERRRKLKAVITPNWFSSPIRAGCHKVIELHGTIYYNFCPHCKEEYSVDFIRQAKKMPVCTRCGAVVRPGIVLLGEMIDNFVMTQAMEEIIKADVVLLCGANLQTALSENYLQNFNGEKLVIINEEEHFSDKKADFVIHDKVNNVLPRLLE